MTEQQKTLRHGQVQTWVVRFEGTGFQARSLQLRVGQGAGAFGQDRAAILEAFREIVRVVTGLGGCRSFHVGVHEHGADCDHEV